MIIFWIGIAGMAVAVAFTLVLTLLRRRSDVPISSDFDISVYRDQLKEVERDVARGTLSPEAAERTRVEVSRRILDADKARAAFETTTAPRMLSLTAAVVVAIAVVGGSLGLYLKYGAPGYGDLPLQARLEASETIRENRPGQEAAETQAAARMGVRTGIDPEFAKLVQRLRDTVAERPDDLQGHVYLAQNEAALGNFGAAHVAQARVLDLLGDEAQGNDWAEYAELLILAAGGYVSPEAETALNAAMEKDPHNEIARYFSGLMFAQTGRHDLAFRIWNQLLVTSAPDDPWVAPIRAQIQETAMRAGVRYDAPDAPAPRGPSAEDMAAASDMTDEDRQAMIEGMVAQLADRLATEGGPPEEWARLIGALGVLGEVSRAQAIWEESQQVFGDDETALAQLTAAARRAGLIQ